MSQEHEKLKKDLNTYGSKLLKEVLEILAMKSHSNRVPYKLSEDNLHLGIRGNRITVQGKQDVKVHCGFEIADNGVVTLVHKSLGSKELSASRASALKSAYDKVIGLFTFYNVVPYEIALESNQGSVALVASTSQGRVAIVGSKGA